MISQIWAGQDIIGQCHYSKVKGQTKVTPKPYGFIDIAWTRFYRSRSLLQGQKSNQGHTMTSQTYTP